VVLAYERGQSELTQRYSDTFLDESLAEDSAANCVNGIGDQIWN